MSTPPRPQARTYSVIYADPPWRFSNWSPHRVWCAQEPRGHRVRGLAPYPCLTTSEIAALPVADLAAKDCLLFLWAVYPMLPDALEVMRAWGFAFKTCAFTRVKLRRSGTGFHLGMGFWTRANPEICLLGVRGHPKRVSRAVPNLVISPLREHSRKPDEVRERIVELCGDLPRVELFARQRFPGWHAWGNDVICDGLPRSVMRM